MKRFRFGLQRVLGVRRIRVRLRQKDLAEALARYEAELYTLGLAQERYRTVTGEVFRHEASGISGPDLRRARLYLDRLAEEIAAHQGRVKAAREWLEQCRQRLLEERRGERALERLRERRRLAHLEEARREEQKVLDEVANRGAAVQLPAAGTWR